MSRSRPSAVDTLADILALLRRTGARGADLALSLLAPPTSSAR